MKCAKQAIVLLGVFLAGLGVGQNAEAQKMSDASSKFVYKVSTVLVRLPPSVCQAEMTQTSKSSALRVQKDLKWNGAPALAALLESVPKNELELPKVKAAQDKANSFLACLKHIESELQMLDKRVDLRKGFRKAAASAQQTIEKLHAFVPNPMTPMWPQDAAEISKWKADLKMVHALCVGPYTGVSSSGAFANDPNHNLALWCQTAAIGERIIKQTALNMVNKEVGVVADKFQKELKDFEQNAGHIRLSRSSLINALCEPHEYRSAVAKRVAPVLAVAGVELGAAFETFDAAHAALWQKIHQSAGGWKHLPQEGREASAIKAARKTFKGDKVIAAYTTRGSWLLHKNSRNEVLGRSKVGVVRYAVKSDKKLAGDLCRTQTFTYYEEKAGRRFKKASAISELGFVRFENCK